ncbi:MAG: ABC transporter substrate-binding protein [Nitrosomonas sp.]|nr:ABC transporter substrate-binding protein [Nitrosomonas sp.]
MKPLLKILPFALVILVIYALPVSAQDDSPDGIIRHTVDEVTEILRKDDGIKAGDQDRILGLIKEKILPHFSFPRMTQLAMGKNWSKASNEQKKTVVEEFRTLLVRTYANSLTNYRDAVIEIEKTIIDPATTRATVKAKVAQGSGRQPVPIDYSMEKTASGWKVYDVTVAGVSLVTNYRGTFNSQIRDSGIDGLIATLSEKNRSLIGQ